MLMSVHPFPDLTQGTEVQGSAPGACGPVCLLPPLLGFQQALDFMSSMLPRSTFPVAMIKTIPDTLPSSCQLTDCGIGARPSQS